MRPEISNDSSNIPHAGISCKKILQTALVGVPVRLRDLALDVAREATVSEVLEVLRRLLDAESKMSVRVRFCLGDAYNQTSRRSEVRKAFVAALRGQLGENYYNLIRKYGWVAAKWPEDRRSDTKCWAFYVNNEPGRPPLPKRPANVVDLAFVSVEVLDGQEVTIGVDARGNVYRTVKHGDTRGTAGN